jgi:3',5'-nucleoside bisphosphate phosphatase
MIDLHVHTNLSDGTLSPEELLAHAEEKGLRALAVTDHDTVAGVRRAQRAGTNRGIEVISGVEVSAQWPSGILHILGFFVRPEDPNLLESLDWLAKGRRDRIPKILSKLESLGVRIAEEDVEKEAVGGVPGRPHVANVLLRLGYVRSMQEAFDRYLRKGSPAYIEKVKLPPEQSVRVIRDAGGIPVLAHPYSLFEHDGAKLELIVKQLLSYGLQGIEAYYSKHSVVQTHGFLRMASRLGLAVTGGSDFHGSNKPEVKLGKIPGFGTLPYSILEKLKDGR